MRLRTKERRVKEGNEEPGPQVLTLGRGMEAALCAGLG